MGGGDRNLYDPCSKMREPAQIFARIENNFLWADLWVLKGALTGLPNAFDNNLRYFRRYLKTNSSENLYFMRATARFVIPAILKWRFSKPERARTTHYAPRLSVQRRL